MKLQQFSHFKNWLLAVFAIAKNGIWSKKNFHEFFWPGLFLISFVQSTCYSTIFPFFRALCISRKIISHLSAKYLLNLTSNYWLPKVDSFVGRDLFLSILLSDISIFIEIYFFENVFLRKKRFSSETFSVCLLWNVQ